MRFSIGYNHDAQFLDIIDKYADHIEAVYFPVPEKFGGTGRAICQPKVYEKEILKIIDKCCKKHLTSQMLLNATFTEEWAIDEKNIVGLLDYIDFLCSFGLKSVVIANPLYADVIKKRIPNIRIESSVNCYVKTVQHACYLKELGIDVITVDRDINRDVDLIRQIKKKTGLKIRIMLNEGCLKNCPFRISHYNYLSLGTKHASVCNDSFDVDKLCMQIYLKDPANLLKVPFIPPEELSSYESFVDYFKLSTRVFLTERIETVLQAYSSRAFNGNLLDILDSPGLSCFEYVAYDLLKKKRFFKKVSKCKNDCCKCNYCKILAEEAAIMNTDLLKKGIKKEKEKAVAVYRNILKRSAADNNKKNIRELLFKALMALKKYYSAFKLIKNNIESNSSVVINDYVMLINAALKSKKEIQAMDIVSNAILKYPKFVKLYFLKAQLLFNIKEYEEAILCLETALMLKLETKGFYYLLASCYMNKGEYRKALKYFKKEQELFPQNNKSIFASAFCYKQLGYNKKAFQELGAVKMHN